MTEEGYIKFQAEWTEGPALDGSFLRPIAQLRQALYKQHLIGAYEDGVGYGNVSRRGREDDQFVITGSKTGNFERLKKQHFTLVTKVDIENNTLWCEGPIIASSESMSHAVIYRECPWVEIVAHVHHYEMWDYYLHKVPTTAASATYGSPEMAYAIVDLLKTTDLPDKQIFVMEGHEEGVFVFGKNAEEVMKILYAHLHAIH